MNVNINLQLIQCIVIRHSDCYIFYQQANADNSDYLEDTMKKFIAMLEDLWVTIAFAEAGVNEPTVVQDLQPHCQDTVHIHTA